MSDQRFCVDCKHFVPTQRKDDEIQEYSKCAYTFSGKFNPVTGRPLQQAALYTSVLRAAVLQSDMCGREGKFFEFACSICNGSGFRTMRGGGSGDPEWDADDQPCPECNKDYSRVAVAP